MKSSLLVLAGLTLAAGTALAAPDSSFSISASAADFDRYFPSYLANGYFSTMTAPRGTEGNLAYMVAFMDYAKDDMARPAAIPGWSEIGLNRKDVGQIAVIIAGPKMFVRGGVDQLHVNANAIAGTADAAFQNVGNTKRLPDLAQILRLAAVWHDRCARDDFQIADLRQVR